MRIHSAVFIVAHLNSLLNVADCFSSLRSGSPKDLSSSILDGLRNTSARSKLLHLETDFYDQSTGLYSEGVWHNALAGIAHLRNNQPADRIANSLFQHSWDGCSFRRRCWSGNWDHSTIESEKPPEQANYYRESSEHRCVQHGMALIFWSQLLSDCEADQDGNNNMLKYREQQKQVADSFFSEFYDPSVQRFTTISKEQGGGSILRPSASAAKQTPGASEASPYYRAVDQAIAVLACLEHLRVLERKTESDATKKEQDMVIDLVQTTCHQIMSPDGFGYVNIEQAKSYIGLKRNRNFWHDGFSFLALIQARRYLWPSDTNHGEAQLLIMWKDLMDKYGNDSDSTANISRDSTIWHWPRKSKTDSSNVRYCGDNALAFAIRRNLDIERSPDNNEDFFRFIGDLQKENDRNLASVADAYPQVRLHPNTELAALLVWP
mmetsp:Transcript_34971/g.41754  ORF Transcript_34971/g.41754 Transcript_34971/m.41754 type:complete len:435 (+) Transcript_34971:66-1370(+)